MHHHRRHHGYDQLPDHYRHHHGNHDGYDNRGRYHYDHHGHHYHGNHDHYYGHHHGRDHGLESLPDDHCGNDHLAQGRRDRRYDPRRQEAAGHGRALVAFAGCCGFGVAHQRGGHRAVRAPPLTRFLG